MKDLELMQAVLDAIPEEPVSVHQLSIKSNLFRRSVQKYLQMIELAQSSKKIVFERQGLRFLVRKEK